MKVPSWTVAGCSPDWSLGACHLVSGWSTSDLRPTPYFPFSSRMAIHGAGRQDYSDGAPHPPAIFRRYERWRLISLRTRLQSRSLSCPSEAAPPRGSCLVCSAWQVQLSQHLMLSLPSPSSTIPLSPQTVRISLFSARESKHTIFHHTVHKCIDLHPLPGDLTKC